MDNKVIANCNVIEDTATGVDAAIPISIEKSRIGRALSAVRVDVNIINRRLELVMRGADVPAESDTPPMAEGKCNCEMTAWMRACSDELYAIHHDLDSIISRLEL